MTPERWEEVKALFAEAIELSDEERAHWIESRHPDPEVAQEVLRLLQEHAFAAGGFLDQETQHPSTLLDRAARILAASVSQPATPGALLSGRYEVIRELGCGGSGIVYLAQDQALHNRPVVLKFLFPGSESQDRLSQRFRQEIEALARILLSPLFRGPRALRSMPRETCTSRTTKTTEFVKGSSETSRS